jgi:hypothetical protein
MDTPKTDLVIQYALAVAGEGEKGGQDLGPIHLLKYVYLADLAHAECEGGKTFTGAPWRFHHFGPWALEVYRRIQPATGAIGANERHFVSPFTDDGLRWRVQDSSLAERIDPRLPWSVASAVKRAVKEFGSDTTALLHFVYRTPPMLRAKPGELLEFRSSPEKVREEYEPASRLKPLSKTALKRIRARLKERSVKLKAASPRLVPPNPPPRYDEVFAQGQQWLDSLAGETIACESGRLTFSDDLWKSDSRGEPKLP